MRMNSRKIAAFLALALCSSFACASESFLISNADKEKTETDAQKNYKESTQSLGKLGVYNRLELLLPSNKDNNQAPLVDKSISWLFPAMSWSLTKQRENEVEAKDGEKIRVIPGLKKGFNQILEYLVEVDSCPNFKIDPTKLEEWRKTRSKDLEIAYADDAIDSSPGSPRILRSLEGKDELYFKALEIFKIAKEKVQKLKDDEVDETELSIALQKFTTATIDKKNLEKALAYTEQELHPRFQREKKSDSPIHTESKNILKTSNRDLQEI